MRLHPRGTFTVDLIDRATGLVREQRKVRNAFTTSGLNFLASALASGSSSAGLHPDNVLAALPRAPNVQRHAGRLHVQHRPHDRERAGGRGWEHRAGRGDGDRLPPAGQLDTHQGDLVRRQRRTLYDLWGAQLRDGSTILSSSAEFEANSFTEKTATDILRVQYEVGIGSAGGIEQAAPVERRIAGFSSTAFAAEVDHDDGGTSPMMIDSTTSTGAVCEVELSYANTLDSGETINDERVNGFTLNIGSGTVIDHDATR